MEKIKQFLGNEKGRDILVVVIVIFVGLASFELGRLSKSGLSSGIKIEYPNQIINQEANVISSKQYSNILQNDKITPSSNGKKFFASNRGAKYYPVGCTAGNSIKQENRVYFITSAEAQNAGYELSSSCK